MREFTKEEICRYLAGWQVPTEPNIELRKMTTLLPIQNGNFLLDNPHLLFPIFNPPEHYSAHPSVDPSKPFSFFNVDIFGYYYSLPPYHLFDEKTDEFLIEPLTNEDKCLLRNILGVYENDNSLLNSTDKFIEHSKTFAESKLKPNWDLQRVLVLDTPENFQNRQQAYEKLLNGKLSDLIKSGEVVQLDDCYTFRKIDCKKYRTNFENEFAYSVLMYPTIGKKMADYIHGQGNELIKIKYCQQINDIIKDALYRGELSLYRLPSFQIVELNNLPSKNNVIKWGDVKCLLEKRTGQNKLFDKPCFENSFSKAIEQQAESVGNDGADADSQGDMETDNGQENDGKPNERQDYFYPIWLEFEKPKRNEKIWKELKIIASKDNAVIESVTGNNEFVFKYQDGSSEPLTRKTFQNDMWEIRKRK